MGSDGLKTVELVNILILRGASETEGVWNWYFQRMKSLVGVSVSNIDASPLMDILASRNDEWEAICPQLANLSITSPTPPLGIEMSRMQQPDIDLKLHVIVDSFGGGDFDFISHYENPTFFASIGPPVSWLTPLQFSTFSSRPGDSRKGGLRKLVILTKYLYVG